MHADRHVMQNPSLTYQKKHPSLPDTHNTCSLIDGHLDRSLTSPHLMRNDNSGIALFPTQNVNDQRSGVPPLCWESSSLLHSSLVRVLQLQNWMSPTLQEKRWSLLLSSLAQVLPALPLRDLAALPHNRRLGFLRLPQIELCLLHVWKERHPRG